MHALDGVFCLQTALSIRQGRVEIPVLQALAGSHGLHGLVGFTDTRIGADAQVGLHALVRRVVIDGVIGHEDDVCARYTVFNAVDDLLIPGDEVIDGDGGVGQVIGADVDEHPPGLKINDQRVQHGEHVVGAPAAKAAVVHGGEAGPLFPGKLLHREHLHQR